MFGVLPSQLAGYDPGSTTKKGKLPINRPVSSKSNLRPSSAKVSTPYSWSIGSIYDMKIKEKLILLLININHHYER